LNARHGSNAQHSRVRTCRRALERGWGVAQGCVDREDGEVVLLTAPEKLRRRQGLRRGEQRVSDVAAGLSRSHCACGVPQLGRSQVVSSCEQRSKSHRIHHEHHCIPIPYQFHDPFGSLHDSHVPFPHVQACERHRQGSKTRGSVVGAARRLSRYAECAARTPQFSRISLRCWDLHWHLSIWHSPHSHVRFPFSDLRGTQRQGPEREGQRGGRAPSLARAICAARTLLRSRASQLVV
jgi:hypothetical protein